MTLLTSLFSAVIPLAQIYLLWRIFQVLKIIANDTQRRADLTKAVQDFREALKQEP